MICSVVRDVIMIVVVVVFLVVLIVVVQLNLHRACQE